MTDTTATSDQHQRPQDQGERLLAWVRNNSRLLSIGVTAIVVLAGGIWFVREYRIRTALAAQSALDAARVSVQAENYPLAASDLTRLIDSYPGTAAAGEAVILLGRVRLAQEQPDVAAQELRAALARGMSGEFLASAYAVLGVALENAGNPADAATAYRQAAEAAAYEFLAAQYLADAGRAATTSGDTSQALELYRMILSAHPESPSAIEAGVRLGELQSVMR
ncbi:MAG TPA: tetratricopeptide repeat protein [Gemmatimonadales bacterium]